MAEDTRPRRSSMPARIGRYRILERVGRGAMGVVYSAQDDSMGRAVAVKVLMGDLESDPETRARFYREAQAAAGLLHPNIITIYDAGEDQGRSFIAMQLLEGWPLANYLQQAEAASLERKLDLMVQMCEGLTAAHGREIVHRDLKPGNLFVQSDGLLKILDFGVARLADSSMTATGAMLGTPDYMSPEQARGTQVDRRSDIFSTGAVFYFMLAGRKPFPGPDLPAVLRQLQFEQPAPIRESEAPSELARLVAQAMAKDPAERPQRIQDLLASIVRFRRHYQGETRRLAADAGARYTAITQGAAELRQAVDVLAIDDPIPDSAVLETLHARYPALLERGGAVFESVAFDRARVTQLLADLEPEHRRVEMWLGEVRQQVEAMEQGQRAREAGDARGAVRFFEQVLAARPSCHRARALLDECRPLAHEQEARDARVADLVAAAQSALDARDWADAIRRSETALAIGPGAPAAAALLVEAQQGSAREQRRKALLLQQAIERAHLALDEQRFDVADAALDEALLVDPQSIELADVRRQLGAARAASADADRVRELAASAIRQARGTFRRGRYEEAIAQLQTFAGAYRVPEAEAELERLSSRHARIARDAQERRQRVQTLLAAARAHAGRGALEDALATAREAVCADVTSDEATATLASVYERDLDERVQREHARVRETRGRDVEPLLVAARQAQARGYVGAALQTAVGALRIAPDRHDIAALIADLRAVIDVDDAETVDLGDEPSVTVTAAVVPRPRQTEDGAAPRAAGPVVAARSGVLASLKQWAAALWRRYRPDR